MTVIESFNIALVILNFFASVTAVMLMIGALPGGDAKLPVNRVFLAMLLLNLAASFSEGMVWLLEGRAIEAIRPALMLCDFFSHGVGVILNATFVAYLYLYLKMKAIPSLSLKPFRVAWSFNAVTFVLAVVNPFFPLYSYFDSHNVYHRLDAFWLSDIIPTFTMLTCLWIAVSHRKFFNRREFVSFVLYSVVPVVFLVLEAFLDGLYVAYIGSTISLFLIYVNIQVELARQLREKEAELLESRVATMLSQLQPHFLYNALGTISSLCDVDAKLAKESIIDFGHYLRGNMDSITQKKPIPFTKEMEHVETYLALERRRFGDRLKVVYGIESTNFNLPSLALQLLVENAVRHGVTKRREGGTVTILASETPHEFRVAVADDGVGFDPECRERDGRSHVGIENVRYRVEAMCGGSLSVESTPGEGTNAVITIPKEAGSR